MTNSSLYIFVQTTTSPRKRDKGGSDVSMRSSQDLNQTRRMYSTHGAISLSEFLRHQNNFSCSWRKGSKNTPNSLQAGLNQIWLACALLFISLASACASGSTTQTHNPIKQGQRISSNNDG